MKTLFWSVAIIIVSLSVSGRCEAQRRAGIYGGVNFSSMRVDPSEPITKQNRLIIGGFGTRQIGSGAAFLFGLQYIEKGGKFDDVDAKLGYLEMLMGLQAGGTKENGWIYLLGGMGLGLLTSARGRMPSASVDVKELFQGGDLSVHGGIGLRIKNFFVEGIYASSLISVIKNEFPQEAFNKGFQLKAGLSFALW